MFNKTIIVGYVGYPPTVKQTKNGSNMCSFNVAVNIGYGDNKNTNWYKVYVFGKQSEYCSKYLTKGSLVCVSGTLELKEYEKDGTTKTSPEIVSDSVTCLTKNKQSSNQNYDKPQEKTQTFDNFNPDDSFDNIPF
jgi:single-strand DNA-binding protein